MKALLALALVSCAGSPDSVTVFGARGTESYQTPNGSPAYDGVGYSVGLALTWQLPTSRTIRLDEQQRELLESVQLMQYDLHAATKTSMPIVVEPPKVEVTVPGEKKDEEHEVDVKIKSIVGLCILAFGGVLLAFLKRMMSKRRKAPKGGA